MVKLLPLSLNTSLPKAPGFSPCLNLGILRHRVKLSLFGFEFGPEFSTLLDVFVRSSVIIVLVSVVHHSWPFHGIQFLIQFTDFTSEFVPVSIVVFLGLVGIISRVVGSHRPTSYRQIVKPPSLPMNFIDPVIILSKLVFDVLPLFLDFMQFLPIPLQSLVPAIVFLSGGLAESGFFGFRDWLRLFPVSLPDLVLLVLHPLLIIHVLDCLVIPMPWVVLRVPFLIIGGPLKVLFVIRVYVDHGTTAVIDLGWVAGGVPRVHQTVTEFFIHIDGFPIKLSVGITCPVVQRSHPAFLDIDAHILGLVKPLHPSGILSTRDSGSGIEGGGPPRRNAGIPGYPLGDLINALALNDPLRNRIGNHPLIPCFQFLTVDHLSRQKFRLIPDKA